MQLPSAHPGPHPQPAERPVLLLGLIGFSAEQEARVAQLLRDTPSAAAEWRLCPFAEADCWWVNGARIRVLADGSLRIPPAIPHGRSVQLDLADVDRPIAFSQPCSAAGFEPACRFDLNDGESVRGVLQDFERWLRPLSAQLWLGAEIVQRESTLQACVYHVIARGRLLAVVDLRGDAGIAPGVGAAQFEGAVWTTRPHSARFIPDNFTRVSASLLMWQYATRTTRDLLPARYRQGPIYFRRAPKLPYALMKDSHLLLMRELAPGPASFEELQQRTGLAAGRLAHELAALYLCGSITSRVSRARPGARMVARHDRQDSTNGSAYSGLPVVLESESPSSFARLIGRLKDTVPAALGQR
jgi:hypothetical protein